MNSNKKALFIQRLGAYLIDSMIIALIASLISSPFIKINKVNSLENKLISVIQNFSEDKIEINEYRAEVNNVSYEIARLSGPLSIITIFLQILYFVVYQLYNKGQTFGKKLLKIKVISDNGDLSINQLIFRSFLANEILLKIINLALIIFATRSVYFECGGLFQSIQFMITVVSIFMVMYSKKGLAVHDRIVHTQVVRV